MLWILMLSQSYPIVIVPIRYVIYIKADVNQLNAYGIDVISLISNIQISSNKESEDLPYSTDFQKHCQRKNNRSEWTKVRTFTKELDSWNGIVKHRFNGSLQLMKHHRYKFVFHKIYHDELILDPVLPFLKIF